MDPRDVMSGEGNADDANAALGGGGGPVDRVSDITSTLTPSGPCVMPPRVRTKGRYAQSVKVHMLNGGKTHTALRARVHIKSTAVRGYAETVSPRLPLTAGGYGPTGTTAHPMTRPPSEDLERPTKPM